MRSKIFSTYVVMCIAFASCSLVGKLPGQTSESPEVSTSSGESSEPAFPELNLNDGPTLSPAELAAADQISHQIGALDWLGPLAPVALSPFFGIACLSGLAIWGGDWIPGHNGLLASPALKNPAVFWSFVVLAVLTSVPRLTKVSKPFAQATDRLEAYSSIIILIVIRLMASIPSGDPQSAMHSDGNDLLVAGVMGFTVDIFLSLAAALNVVVINTIKFFFEILVWLTPIPSIDAVFELVNKSLCASLMAVYAFSPLVATMINLTMFAVCLIAFRWVSRRVRFYRTLLTEPLFGSFVRQLTGRKLKLSDQESVLVTLFPLAKWTSFPAKTRVYAAKTAEGWKFVWWRWPLPMRSLEVPAQAGRFHVTKGWFCYYLEFKPVDQSGEQWSSIRFVTPWRHAAEAREVSEHFGWVWIESATEVRHSELRTEWS